VFSVCLLVGFLELVFVSGVSCVACENHLCLSVRFLSRTYEDHSLSFYLTFCSFSRPVTEEKELTEEERFAQGFFLFYFLILLFFDMMI
jgi:hypothetical protein